jgi:hypothetical protein
MLRMLQMPKEGCFAFSRLASNVYTHSKSGGKPASQNHIAPQQVVLLGMAQSGIRFVCEENARFL